MYEIKSFYTVLVKGGRYTIKGTNEASGEEVFIKEVTESESEAKSLADFLNRNGVSVCHAKDVIRDRLLEFMYK